MMGKRQRKAHRQGMLQGRDRYCPAERSFLWICAQTKTGSGDVIVIISFPTFRFTRETYGRI